MVGWTLREGEHALITSPNRGGKSAALVTIATHVWAELPGVAVTAITPRSTSPLAALAAGGGGGGLALASSSADVDAVGRCGGPQLVLVDDCDEIDDGVDFEGALGRLLSLRRPDLHIIGAGRPDTLRSRYGHWTGELRRSRHGLALRPVVEQDGDLWQVRLPLRGPSRWPDGRGYLIAGGGVELVQMAKDIS